jgi:hypothetical protein
MDLRRGDAVLPGKMPYHIILAARNPIPVARIELRRVGCHVLLSFVAFADDV